jgi:hypothetical protein
LQRLRGKGKANTGRHPAGNWTEWAAPENAAHFYGSRKTINRQDDVLQSPISANNIT